MPQIPGKMDEQGDVVMGGTSDSLPEPSSFLTIQAKATFANQLSLLIKLTGEPIPDLGSEKEQIVFLTQKSQTIADVVQLLQICSDILAGFDSNWPRWSCPTHF